MFDCIFIYRLRDLLQTEEEEYMAEAASKKETVLERQARMRERARSLREKREKERLALVEDKLDQRWKLVTNNYYYATLILLCGIMHRSQCEELRSMQSKCKEEQIYKSRSELLRLRDEERKRDAQSQCVDICVIYFMTLCILSSYFMRCLLVFRGGNVC